MTTTKKFITDGHTKRFLLSESPEDRAAMVLSIKVNGEAKSMGIVGNNLTTFQNDFEALVDFPSNAIDFPADLAEGDEVAVEYIAYETANLAPIGKTNDTATHDARSIFAKLEARIAALEAQNTELSTRIAVLEARQPLSIEAIEGELARRYKRQGTYSRCEGTNIA